MIRFGLAAIAALSVAGCAGDDPPPAAVAQAETAIEMARQADAATLAPLPLRVAEDRLAAAVAAFEDDDDETATMLAEQARANAQLAQAQAGAARTQRATRELQGGVDAMRRGAGEGQTAEAPLTAPGALAPALPPR